MPHRKQWIELARAFFTPLEDRTDRQMLLTGGASFGVRFRYGICNGVKNTMGPLCEQEFQNTFFPHNKAIIPYWYWKYWWPRTEAGDKKRSDFCITIAEMGGDTYNEMVGGN